MEYICVCLLIESVQGPPLRTGRHADEDVNKFVCCNLIENVSRVARTCAGELWKAYIFPNHYVAIVQLVCGVVVSSLQIGGNNYHRQPARIVRMVFSSVFVSLTVVLI